MTEKIEWYKEVLELEPNSKVFFPLARMLAEEQRYDEAVEVLEHGLERHSEFLEARLFFIELLFKTGRETACTVQVNKLSKMFAAYAGFWQAWAACLSASAIRRIPPRCCAFWLPILCAARFRCTPSWIAA